ncbi:hypothetical protein V8C44DRAFT_315689 [Trichoderma aethiopicum]
MRLTVRGGVFFILSSFIFIVGIPAGNPSNTIARPIFHHITISGLPTDGVRIHVLKTMNMSGDNGALFPGSSVHYVPWSYKTLAVTLLLSIFSLVLFQGSKQPPTLSLG